MISWEGAGQEIPLPRLIMEKANIYGRKMEYAGFDIAKFIFAIFVVAIHVDPFSGCTNEWILRINNYLFSLAVPFFFAMSGFLLFRKTVGEKLSSEVVCKRIRAYLLRTVQLYLLWNLIYLPISIYGYIINDMSFLKSLLFYIKDFLFLGEHYFSWPFWYLLAVIYGLGLIYFFIRCHAPSWVIVLLGMICYRGADIVTYSVQNKESFNGFSRIIIEFASHTFATGRIFSSVLFLVIGMVIARNSWMHHVNLSVRLGLFLSTLMIYMWHPTGYIYMIGRPLIVLFGIWALIGISFSDRPIYGVFRKSSMVFYFTHMIFYFIWTLFMQDTTADGMVTFFFVIGCCTVLTGIVLLWSKKRSNLEFGSKG